MTTQPAADEHQRLVVKAQAAYTGPGRAAELAAAWATDCLAHGHPHAAAQWAADAAAWAAEHAAERAAEAEAWAATGHPSRHARLARRAARAAAAWAAHLATNAAELEHGHGPILPISKLGA